MFSFELWYTKKGFKIIRDQNAYLRIEEKYNFFGNRTCTFFYEEKKILQTYHKQKLLGVEISILFQDLDEILDLRLAKDNYELHYGGCVATLSTKLFKNPVLTLYENEEQICEVSAPVIRFSSSEKAYDIKFIKETEYVLYLLIYLCIMLPEEGGSWIV